MCDILYIPPEFSLSGNAIFAKNSDREPDEAQAIEFVPRQIHCDSTLRCTFISIPQVKETHACILSRPFQMWGAEMGVNEHGVVIGNEAVFTRIKFKKDNSGLTGMDMLRVALERSTSARTALECIINLLEIYGQDACGGYRNKNFFYHNSFLIADAREAYVLETAGKYWAVENVRSVRSLSNHLSIHQPDRMSNAALNLALRKKRQKPFSFAKSYSDWLYSKLGRGAQRAAKTCSLALQSGQLVTAFKCMQILQSHNLPASAFTPSRATTASICMHATGMFNPSETTGSMVAEVRKDKPHTVWLTGTPHPCLSVYIPFFFTQENALTGIIPPSDKPDGSLWWTARKAHQWIIDKYLLRKPLIEEERQTLQKEFIEGEAQLILRETRESEFAEYSRHCISKTLALYSKWIKKMVQN